jgi:hypothetical protein
MSLFFNNRSSPARAWQVLIPLGILITAATVGASKDDGSAPPPAPDPAKEDSSILPPSEGGVGSETPPKKPLKDRRKGAAVSRLEIRTLRAGPGPYAWEERGRVVGSFITDSAEALELRAEARIAGHPELDGQIEWEVTPPEGFALPEGASLRGETLALRLARPKGNPTGGGGLLSMRVAARLSYGGKTYEAGRTLTQDLRDRLRQEYVDLKRIYVPRRDEFIDEAQYVKLYGKKYPRIRFSALNFSKVPDTEERYPFIMVTERLVKTLQETEKLYGRPLPIVSAFRDPVRQLVVHGSVGESHHQYGRAADIYVAPDSAPPRTGRNIATPNDWLRLATAALRGGGVWIEPMLDVHVNTASCHVHVDVRERGSHSRIVQVAGKVTDPAGSPVSGATVTLAGMPAVTDARGDFMLKHVVTPHEYDLEIEAPGRAPVTQKVRVGEDRTMASIQLPADPQPTLTARAEPLAGGTGGPLTLRVALKNVGGSEARGLRLSAVSSGRAATAASVLPARLASLGPGKEALFQVRVAAPGGEGKASDASLRLLASFQTPAGQTRTQDFPVQASAGEAVPVPGAEDRGGERKRERTGTLSKPRPAPDPGAAAGGMAVGGAAAAASALARRKGKPGAKGRPAGVAAPEAAPEPSVDPSAVPEPPAEPAKKPD